MTSWTRFAARIAIPGAILLAGVVLLFLPGLGGLGFGLIVISVLVWLTNILGRLTLSSDDDRDREQRSREVYARTGRWPDDSAH